MTPSHYQSQWWLKSILPYGINRLQWTNQCRYKFFDILWLHKASWVNCDVKLSEFPSLMVIAHRYCLFALEDVVDDLWEPNMAYPVIRLYWCSHAGQGTIHGYLWTSNVRRTKSQNLNVSRLILQLSFPNPLKPGVWLRMKMYLEQRRQAMLQLDPSEQPFYCLLRCNLY